MKIWNRDRGRPKSDPPFPSHTTGRSGPHPAVRKVEAGRQGVAPLARSGRGWSLTPGHESAGPLLDFRLRADHNSLHHLVRWLLAS